MDTILLRDYQSEVIEEIQNRGDGKWLIVLPTGAGKTVVFTHLPRTGRTLILAHRKELIEQPAKYFDCPVGVEMGKSVAADEPVVIASMQTMLARLSKFDPYEFNRIIIDEAHRAVCSTYQKITDHFKPRQLLGFTATPNRADNVGLNSIFQEVIYQKDLRFMLERGYLCPIKCFRADIGYDISGVASRLGDLNATQLEQQVNIDGANKAIVEALEKKGKLPAIIFCCSVAHSEALAELIPGAVAVTGGTKERSQIMEDFRANRIPVLTTVEVLTEGTDLPNAVTAVMARPTESAALYTQMAGRIMRLSEGKECGIIIDCAGNTSRHSLASAATLLGYDLDCIPGAREQLIEGDLLADLPELIEKESDCPETWIRNIELVNIFAKQNKYNLYDINYTKHPDGAMIVSLPKNRWVGISPIDSLGRTCIIKSWTTAKSESMPAQEAFDRVMQGLKKHFLKERPLWSASSIKRWGKIAATQKQRNYIRGLSKGKGIATIDINSLSKRDAIAIINRLKRWQ